MAREGEQDTGLHAEGTRDADDASDGTGVASPESIQAILRILAETQQQMLRNQNVNGGGKARILASVKIPYFDGAHRRRLCVHIGSGARKSL